MAKQYDWLVVGAGFTGAVVAERLAEGLNQSVMLIDRRDHVGGNAYDMRDEAGNLIHLYGPHIFHTNSDKVFHYLSRFTTWRPYFHRVLGHVDGNLIPIPFNLDSLERAFPPAMAARLSDKLVAAFGFGAKVPIMKLKDAVKDDELAFLSDYIFDKVFLHYTTKQWGMTPAELDPSVTARVPVVVNRDSRYFQDRYQAMPTDGYTALFKRLLDHPNIDVRLKTEWRDVRDQPRFKRLVFCGPLDEYFDHSAGVLPYRSLRFDFQTHSGPRVQDCGTINYPNEFDFTRVTDFSYLSGETRSTTSVVYEYPEAFEPGRNDPYYPIPSPQTKALLAPYQKMAATLRGKVWFAGRLADYQYYNMDQACARGLSLFEKELAPAVRGQLADTLGL